MVRNLTRFDPRSDIARVGAFPDIGNFFRGLGLSPLLRELEQAPRMKVDIEDNEQVYTLKAEVPGAQRDDLNVTIAGNTVSIQMNVSQESSSQQGSMLRAERIYGEEYRTFSLPQEIDEARADAKLENGILVLTLPKKTSATKLDIRQQAAGDGVQGQSVSGASQPPSSPAQGQSGGGASEQEISS